ncbi:uncharacterized protein JCM15063_002793 [Sporobolomyces koalae]|uniref:uncharacterized protein n=1 Tax=Sporobolomyces koalae TaxID=500713 RepID=UPI003174954C
MDGQIVDIHLSEAFVEYARSVGASSDARSESAEQLVLLKYQSKPASLANLDQPGTIWSSTPTNSSRSTSIYTSFPSTASTTTNPVQFVSSSITTPPTDELVLVLDPTCTSFQLFPPPIHSVNLKPQRAVLTVPDVPTSEQLGKQAREFWETDAVNPFHISAALPALKASDGDDDDDDEDEDEEALPKLATVPPHLRNPVSSKPARASQVEDFGAISLGPREPTDASTPSAGLVLPKKPPIATIPPTSAPRHPQFSSKIPASASRPPIPPLVVPATSTNDANSSSGSSSEPDDDDDADFEDVSVPSAPLATTHPSPSRAPPTASQSRHEPTPIPAPHSTPVHAQHKLSTSLQNIVINPPTSSSPVRPNSTASSSRPLTTIASKSLPPIKKRKSSLLPEDQASSDSSSSSGSSSSSSDNDESDLEASINASMAGNSKRVAMSSGGKGKRLNASSTTTTTTTTNKTPVQTSSSHTHPRHQSGAVGTNAAGRPMVSRKGLAPPAPVPVTTSTNPNSREARSRTTTGGSSGGNLSAYDAQRLAQYASNPALLHSRQSSTNQVSAMGAAGGVGAVTASPLLGVKGLDSDDDDDDDDDDTGSESD